MSSKVFCNFDINYFQCLCDEEDFYLVDKYTWNVTHKGNTSYLITDINKKRVYFHQLVCPDFKLTDHKNQNGLDNRRENLRSVNKSQNAYNSVKRKNCSSKYKGVSWNKRDKYFEAYITVDKKRIRLGYYKNEIDAAKAYDAAAKLYHKEYARINFNE